MNRLDILIFGAHPDDAEIGMGATICKHTQAGLAVGICDLTAAEMSSNGDVDSRRAEAQTAGELLGLATRSNLGLPDRGLTLTHEHIEPVVREIRRWRPRLVFAPYWIDRHPDHVMCSRIVEEAVFNAKLRRWLPEVEAHSAERLYFYYINDVADPHLCVDVTAEQARKMEALAAYRSQFVHTDGDVATPINQDFLSGIEARDRALGAKAGCRYAEGFAVKRPIILPLL